MFRLRMSSFCFSLLVLAIVVPADAAPPRLPMATPEEAGMDSAKLAEIDAVVAEGLAAKKMPGCVVLVSRHGKIVLLKAYGHRQVEPSAVQMTTDTIFDMASITKPMATATSIMLLVEQGKLELDAPAAKYWPEFGTSGKESITIRQLLTHQSGLIADNALSDYQDNPHTAMAKIASLKLQAAPGTKFIYSDVGFIVLGELVRRVSRQDLNEFTQRHLYGPLALVDTGYLPGPEQKQRAAPTEKRNGEWIQGDVHDPRAYKLNGVAGHAGLFSTAEDTALFGQVLLEGGTYAGVRILAPETVSRMTEPNTVPGGDIRALGWDMQSAYSSNRGKSSSNRAFGHGGFTGTTFWLDPELQLCVIFLSNRVHPNGQGSVNPLAGRIGTIAADAITKRDQLGRVETKPTGK